MATGQELNYQQNASAMQMADAIMGDGVTVVAASYDGANQASSTYTGGDTITPGVTPGDTGVILSTGRIRDFTQNNADPNRSTFTSTDNNNNDNMAQFNALAGANTYDAALLSIDFIPTGDVMSMQFIFSSDEYPEYFDTIYNDAVGVWINGNVVPMGIGDGSVSVTNVGATNGNNLFINNTGDDYNTEMDGFTVTLTLTIPVISGQVNSIQIGIADVTDGQGDSNLVIAGGSMQTVLVADDDEYNILPNGTKIISVLDNDTSNTGVMVITHINNQAISIGSSITLSTGQTITLNADGTLTVVADADEETINFTYTVSDGAANTDVAFVTLNSVPCFVAGTKIKTPLGQIAVEDLQVGDLVATMDSGDQPLRWIGHRRVAALDNLAPIAIAAGTFGDHGELRISPQHRILFQDLMAELLFAEHEVLVKAKDLVNGTSVRVFEGGEVEYYHLLFDDHEIVFSNGLATESYLPGPQSHDAFLPEVYDEICKLFPEIDPETGLGYGDAGRMMLKGYEAKVLLTSAGFH